ncbi:MAG TPA: nuclear transport factor 2 family protein [Candidatus Sulfotelmatobacter sp.]|nr:nuclear transport factor 2 family protein [Candidatus Sulfotelmatobacter sp.]
MPDSNQLENLVNRLHQAMMQRDALAFASCFESNYVSEQPCHPDRNFQGTQQVLKNWTALFHSVPDFSVELLRSIVGGDTAWTEWRWFGHRRDGSSFDMRGVIILMATAGLFQRGCLYMEPLDTTGKGIDAAVQTLAGSK